MNEYIGIYIHTLQLYIHGYNFCSVSKVSVWGVQKVDSSAPVAPWPFILRAGDVMIKGHGSRSDDSAAILGETRIPWTVP